MSALRELENLDGAYVLKTDLSKKEFPTGCVLQEYKEPIHVERRIGDIKGPLAIAPLFLEKPLRIAGLMYILLWALMTLALMERDVRQSLDGEPMYGIYPENRPSPSLTGASILEWFATCGPAYSHCIASKSARSFTARCGLNWAK